MCRAAISFKGTNASCQLILCVEAQLPKPHLALMQVYAQEIIDHWHRT